MRIGLVLMLIRILIWNGINLEIWIRIRFGIIGIRFLGYLQTGTRIVLTINVPVGYMVRYVVVHKKISRAFATCNLEFMLN
jgi:hypothetical protein